MKFTISKKRHGVLGQPFHKILGTLLALLLGRTTLLFLVEIPIRLEFKSTIFQHRWWKVQKMPTPIFNQGYKKWTNWTLTLICDILLTYCFKTLFYCSCSNGNICHFHEYMMTFLSMRKCAKTWESMARYDKKIKVCKNKRKREKLCPKVYTKWNKVKWELSMPKYSRVCKSILKYTIVCKRMRGYAKAFKNSQKFTQVCESI